MADAGYEGKVALVTGAGAKRGMGRAIALRLGAAGAKVAILDKFAAPRSNFPGDEGWGGLEEELGELGALGAEAIALTADINESTGCAEAVRKIVDRFGRLDLLVHCAAIRGPVGVPVVDFTEADWRALMDVNLTGTFLISKPVAQHMVARGGGGKMVLISSVGGKVGAPGNAAYTASKWGVIGYVQSLALELAKYRINVNSVCPGHMNTNLRDQWIEEQAKLTGVSPAEFRERAYAEMAKTVPLGRYGTAEDVADVVMFLLSPQADYMTGQAINISGGICMS
ncbi:MAG: SDR family oxidoreductase [Deltaproteobacteria bacterium]|nr:SDR family oxidoreductase [Deltaproteobacteria bacterium]